MASKKGGMLLLFKLLTLIGLLLVNLPKGEGVFRKVGRRLFGTVLKIFGSNDIFSLLFSGDYAD